MHRGLRARKVAERRHKCAIPPCKTQRGATFMHRNNSGNPRNGFLNINIGRRALMKSSLLGGGAAAASALILNHRQPAAEGEDCLVINVFTPGVNDGRKRPVMVWLHGGGFAGGAGSAHAFDGTNLARSGDVVVVSVNHRLNIFGYLYLADLGGEKYADSGNAGLLDIVAVLEWVRENVVYFGGNPGNVTMFGQSGGGLKISTLLAMPPAKGLFHKAIIESRSALKGIRREEANKTTGRILSKLGLQENQVDQLQTLPVAQLLSAIDTRGAAQGTIPFTIAPVVDGRALPSDPFDPTAPAISA